MGSAADYNQVGGASVAGGAATGAAIGTFIAPGIGTLVGAAIGSAVGGMAGAIGIGNKAKKYAKKAKAVQREREMNAQSANYLSMIREARLARAGSLAAATYSNIATSSLTSSALSSIGSQSQYSVQFTANDQRLVQLYNHYMKKAGAAAKAASTTQTIGQLSSMAFGLGAAGLAASSTAAASANASVGISGVGDTLAVNGSMEAAGLGSGASWGTIGSAWSSAYNAAYTQAFSSNLMQVSLWSNVSSQLNQGISQYNRI